MSASISEPLPACLEQVLDFEFGVRPLVAFQDGRSIKAHFVSLVGSNAYLPGSLQLCGGVESFAIFFHPTAFSQLFRIPMTSVVNCQYDAYDVLGASIQQLWDRMAGAPTFQRRVEFAEDFLLRRAASSASPSVMMQVANHVFLSSGRDRIADVANQTWLSPRQFGRRFIDEIGLSPKLYSRIARFQAALDAKIANQNSCWLDLAYEYGYFDQMHMIKEFQKLSGSSPSSLMDRIGDMRPPALTEGYFGIDRSDA